MRKSMIEQMKDVIKVQESNGSWNYDPYMHGMYNGMELMLSIAEGRDPVYREAPQEWLADREPDNTPPTEAENLN